MALLSVETGLVLIQPGRIAGDKFRRIALVKASDGVGEGGARGLVGVYSVVSAGFRWLDGRTCLILF